MSREIKFRAWDKEKKKYLLPEEQDFVILPTKPSFGVTIPFQSEYYPNENLDVDCVDWADADLLMGRYELEQYTGLKDKNGKEIYEGDIVEGDMGIFEVKWYDLVAQFMFAPNIDMKWHPPFVYDQVNEMEVIGNIHENPKLIGGEE